jgi:protoporphyrinogen oxidase
MGECSNSVIVLGAGLTGLSAADILASRGQDVVVIERDQASGGLASTVREDGFHFDFGPHRFHTQKPALLDRVAALLPASLLELQRMSRIRLLDRYFQYPLSLNDVLRRMPFHEGAGMILSYMGEKVRNIVSPRNEYDFEGWVLRRFGRKLYDIYFGPYTEKLWGCAPSTLSADWASQRITVPGLTGLLRETLFPSEGKVRSLVSTFHYPRGGIGNIADAFEERIRSAGGAFVFGNAPSCISRKADGSFLVTAGGLEYGARRIVSTIPVTEYVRLLGDLLPADVHRAASTLAYRALVFVTIRVAERPGARDHWIYLPEEGYLFNRLSIPENFDEDLPVDGYQVVFEFSAREGDAIWKGEVDLIGEAIEGGIRLGLFERSAVTASMVTRQTHAYPIYDLGYASRVAFVLDGLDNLPGSVTCGRQGLFRYNNMDHSIEMGEFAALETLGESSIREQFDWTADTWADG